jgi:hypothetical protein
VQRPVDDSSGAGSEAIKIVVVVFMGVRVIDELSPAWRFRPDARGRAECKPRHDCNDVSSDEAGEYEFGPAGKGGDRRGDHHGVDDRNAHQHRYREGEGKSLFPQSPDRRNDGALTDRSDESGERGEGNPHRPHPTRKPGEKARRNEGADERRRQGAEKKKWECFETQADDRQRKRSKRREEEKGAVELQGDRHEGYGDKCPRDSPCHGRYYGADGRTSQGSFM